MQFYVHSRIIVGGISLMCLQLVDKLGHPKFESMWWAFLPSLLTKNNTGCHKSFCLYKFEKNMLAYVSIHLHMYISNAVAVKATFFGNVTWGRVLHRILLLCAGHKKTKRLCMFTTHKFVHMCICLSIMSTKLIKFKKKSTNVRFLFLKS